MRPLHLEVLCGHDDGDLLGCIGGSVAILARTMSSDPRHREETRGWVPRWRTSAPQRRVGPQDSPHPVATEFAAPSQPNREVAAVKCSMATLAQVRRRIVLTLSPPAGYFALLRVAESIDNGGAWRRSRDTCLGPAA